VPRLSSGDNIAGEAEESSPVICIKNDRRNANANKYQDSSCTKIGTAFSQYNAEMTDYILLQQCPSSDEAIDLNVTFLFEIIIQLRDMSM
jgi:hypothetical protein